MNRTGSRRVAAGVPAGGQFAAAGRGEADDTVARGLFFHVASETAHDSITEHGLDHTRGTSAYAETCLDYPPGNYLFADPAAAAEYAAVRAQEERDEYGLLDASDYNIYAVDLPAGLAPVQDPFHDDESGLGASAVYVTDPIPADAVRPVG